MKIAPLTPTDTTSYRDLMLEAYEQAPDAFTSTADERRAEPLSWWHDRIAKSGIAQAFGAFSDDKLVGSVALEYSAKPKTRHSALLIGMYVQAGYRGRHVGSLLLEAALESARRRPEIQVIRLTVTEGNEPAIGLYRRAGFEAWGTEPLSILTPGGFKGKVHMSLSLRGDAIAECSSP